MVIMCKLDMNDSKMIQIDILKKTVKFSMVQILDTIDICVRNNIRVDLSD